MYMGHNPHYYNKLNINYIKLFCKIVTEILGYNIFFTLPLFQQTKK